MKYNFCHLLPCISSDGVEEVRLISHYLLYIGEEFDEVLLFISLPVLQVKEVLNYNFSSFSYRFIGEGGVEVLLSFFSYRIVGEGDAEIQLLLLLSLYYRKCEGGYFCYSVICIFCVTCEGSDLIYKFVFFLNLYYRIAEGGNKVLYCR